MAYSEELAGRVRDELGPETRITEQQMFGGLCFLWAGNMICGVQRDELLVRVGADLRHDALTRPHVREMEFTGRSMKGFVTVGRDGLGDEQDLELWVRLGLAHARTFPPKQAPAKKQRAAKKKVAVPEKPAATKPAVKKTAVKKTASKVARQAAKPVTKTVTKKVTQKVTQKVTEKRR